MPHPDTDDLDDGILEAFLDGALPADEVRRVEAQLAASPALRARLAAARAIREEAAALLALVEPVPPAVWSPPGRTEENRRAGGTSRETPQRRVRPWYDQPAWRWAAGVLLVAGAAWVVRPGAGPVTAPVAQAPEVAPAAPPLPAEGARSADALAKAVPPQGQVTTMAAPQAESRARPRPATIAAESDARTQPIEPAAESTVGASAGTLDELNAAANRATERTAERTAAVAPSASIAARKSALADASAPAPRSAPAATADAAPPPAPPAPGRLITLPDATALLGVPARTLNGLTPRRVVLLRETPPLVATDYLLPDGRLVVLEQEPLTTAAPGSGWTDGPLRLRLTAALPADSLAALRRSVRPADSP